ncbi:hypothetical protein KKF70_06680 [bacterium]|nr:hypothetical protein [bacterium]
MAKINIKTTVTAPDEINVQLVRADYLEISNIFRLCFEICLALTATLIGVVLSVLKITMLHKLFLGFVSVGTLFFLGLTIHFYCKAKPCGASEKLPAD